MSTRRIDLDKVRARRRPAAAAPAIAPTETSRPGYELRYGTYAFRASVHRVGCTCNHGERERAALLTDTWSTIQREPIVARFTALSWRITRGPCAPDLS